MCGELCLHFFLFYCELFSDRELFSDHELFTDRELLDACTLALPRVAQALHVASSARSFSIVLCTLVQP